MPMRPCIHCTQPFQPNTVWEYICDECLEQLSSAPQQPINEAQADKDKTQCF